MKVLGRICCIGILFICTSISFAQTSTIELIKKDVEIRQIERARKNYQILYEKYLSQHSDSLIELIPVLGKILYAESSSPPSEEILLLTQKGVSITKNPQLAIQAYLYVSEYFNYISKSRLAYTNYREALSLVEKHSSNDYNKRGQIENNLAITAFKMNDIGLSNQHQRKAIQWIKKSKSPDYTTLYSIYSSKGSSEYFAYQLDSALHYYQLAEQYLEKSDKDSLEKKYSHAVLRNNVAGIYSLQGLSHEAISSMKMTIADLEYYLSHKSKNDKFEEASQFLYEAIDNLAGIYRNIGDYHRGLSLLNYSYRQKIKNLPNHSDALYKSEILLGQAYLSVQDLGRAKQSLQKSFDRLNQLKVKDDFWLGDAHFALARVYESCQETDQALQHYEQANQIYQNALQGSYDAIYLDFLHHLSLFYADNHQLDKALKTALFIHDYTQKNEGFLSLQSYWNLLGLSKIHLQKDQKNLAEKNVHEALEVVHQLMQQKNQSLLDSVRLEQLIPSAELLKAKIQYQNLSVKNSKEIQSILQNLYQLEKVFERKKMFLLDENDISQVNNDYQEILDFINQLHIELYSMTQDKKYLQEIVQRHESNVYSRIRSHLSRQNDVRFSNVPNKIQVQEKQLRQNLLKALSQSKGEKSSLQDYYHAEKKWTDFEQMLQKKYPEYFQTRYQNSTLADLKSLQDVMTSDQTIIRYFFIDRQLYALVVDKTNARWVELNVRNLQSQILQLMEMNQDEIQICHWSHELYLQLWKPLEQYIQHSRVMIIPEGILYYLSFDMLSTQKVKSFYALKQSALLQKFAISYHYSLYGITPTSKGKSYKRNFTAFVPEFSDENKEKYQKTLKMNSPKDEEYLSLLPLPFSVQLAQKAQKLFGGNVYAGDLSHIQNFKNFASNSSIVHIGTHASANDEYPEYSKLFFSKNIKDLDHENVLYLYDIYQHHIQSEITVLTACESGKSGLFPGEGMISMAHAFNYAGSKSILTGLWNIDEKSSTQIVEEFYKNLKKGWTKDVALQQAKISFLEDQNGRWSHPQYWAGLVLLGDMNSVEMNRHFSPWLLLLAGVVLGTGLYYFGRRKKYDFHD